MAVSDRTAGALARRLAALDWEALPAALDERGYWRSGRRVLTARQCDDLKALYGDPGHFRKRVEMARLGFGVGDYQYLRRPLPRLVAALRTALYRRLAPVVNRWDERLGGRSPFPPALGAFLRHCAEHGQVRPTPLLLHYAAGGYNCLHQDLYGDVAFPLQATFVLSRPGVDYEGGEFLLVENPPRAQARGEAIALEQGELIVFPTRERPAAGRRGFYRVRVRHGLSRLRSGERYALGIIFHDAR